MRKNKLKKLNKIFGMLISSVSLICCYGLGTSWAAPSISAVQGAIINGGIVTIKGSGFGSEGPKIALFDDFEKGINGDVISTSNGSAQVNQWYLLDSVVSKRPRYSSTYAHSGSKSVVIDCSTDNASEGGRWFEADIEIITSKVYVQYWIYVPTGGYVPGAGGPYDGNWKTILVSGRPWPKSDFTQVLLGNNFPYTGWGFICGDFWYDRSGLSSMTAATRGYHDPGYCSLNIAKGTWHRLEVFIVGSTSGDGYMYTAEVSANQPWRIVGLTSNATTLHSGDAWNLVRFPAYVRGDVLSKVYYDDIYIATGQGARARVEIGNNLYYNKCTNLAVITPTIWSDISITATIRQGSFVTGSPAYLFVCNANGLCNSSGYPVVIGVGG
jgi:hypothetical protein